MTSQKNSRPFQRAQPPTSSQISCNRTYLRYDLCSIDGPTVLDPTTYTFFTVGPTSPTVQVEKIKPYPRKYEDYIMAQIKELSITSGPPSPSCTIQHDAPALVFSAGGYSGNLFHAFNDGFIPLFITASSIYPDRDFIMVVSEAHDWWLGKYADLLKVFSKHPIVTLEKDNATHCFPSATLGLISHGFMTINQTLIPTSKTFMHFRGLLDKAYCRNPISSPPHRPKSEPRPRLILTCRGKNVVRRIINQDEIIQIMKEVGFDVIVFEPTSHTPLHEAYAMLNSSHAMVGVHGAALTHALFLRPGSVFMQVVPIGLDWAADAFFARVAKGLNLEYIDYKIGVEESSLVEKYGKDNMLLKDPYALRKKGWPTEIMDIYLKEQNVKLDLVRFRKSLEDAYLMAKKFMHREG
ncbi:protein O-linked-mannose beta-1,4-N-acetylglucosaminyltransferase 2-like [Durio zibethinus]|uniref:Protein O-linked-mannose beta-1,4-N-acetylglucosaminyltransferase 2-like n=1 Tax=Durio zibethinus TaxID=66656 RepID=A0A6P6BFC2_DURZI|nr:protein O-linked-mannose beta-1,4-N-acetylglucosaminyltransferase 2-like [Durio zibethinus]